MKMKSWTLGILAICLLSSHLAFSKDADKTNKESCKSNQAQIDSLQKQIDALKLQLDSLDQQREKAKAKFEEYRAKLDPTTNCSEGNPNNTQECLKILAGLKESGAEINRVEQDRLGVSHQKNSVDDQILTPLAMKKALQCP